MLSKGGACISMEMDSNFRLLGLVIQEEGQKLYKNFGLDIDEGRD